MRAVTSDAPPLHHDLASVQEDDQRIDQAPDLMRHVLRSQGQLDREIERLADER